MAATKEIVVNVLKQFSEKKTSRGINRIRVVQYNAAAPQLEKREFWTDENDEEKPGKAKGILLEDFEMLMQNAEEIKGLLAQVVKKEEKNVPDNQIPE
jgi:hypothetical protein